ncbi:hypothetical protein ACWGCP_32640 [Streptomyces niveus]
MDEILGGTPAPAHDHRLRTDGAHVRAAVDGLLTVTDGPVWDTFPVALGVGRGI